MKGLKVINIRNKDFVQIVNFLFQNLYKYHKTSILHLTDY